MNAEYRIDNADEMFSPALVFYKSLIARNIAEVVRLAGSPDRLIPHVKTHKCREIAQMQIDAGILHHKCATIAEAEMLAQVGAPSILIAYPIIGPNVGRVRALVEKYPASCFAVLADHPDGVAMLSRGFANASSPLDVLMDVNVGHDRTGIRPGPAAIALYEKIATSPGLRPAGLHVYDGHNHQEKLADREGAVRQLIGPVLDMRRELENRGLSVPTMVCGGTPTFPVWSKITDVPGLVCSPGTFVLYDSGYGAKYAELSALQPAALVVSRVISRPTPTRVTTDMGHKAIAADPPAGKRATLLNVGEYTTALQNEEHFAFDVPDAASADQFRIGDLVYAIPTHVCPTVALHRRAYIVENNRIIGTWEIASRDRVITI